MDQFVMPDFIIISRRYNKEIVMAFAPRQWVGQYAYLTGCWLSTEKE